MISYYRNGLQGLEDCGVFEPDCWINVETPTAADKSYLINELQVPESFYDDIEDIDERPRIEFEDGWYLVILRIPVKTDQANLPFYTVPLGITFKGNIFVSICFFKNTHDQELVEDVEIELRQAQDTTKIYSDILSGMMDTYASVISNNLNIIMKLLTSISIILMIPTLIASFYGMNVPNVFQENHYGFWIVMLISFSISVLCVFVFRRMKLF